MIATTIKWDIHYTDEVATRAPWSNNTDLNLLQITLTVTLFTRRMNTVLRITLELVSSEWQELLDDLFVVLSHRLFSSDSGIHALSHQFQFSRSAPDGNDEYGLWFGLTLILTYSWCARVPNQRSNFPQLLVSDQCTRVLPKLGDAIVGIGQVTGELIYLFLKRANILIGILSL